MERARITTPLGRILDEEGRRQSWLADKIGAQSHEVNRWVHGIHVPRESTRRAIADALGRHVDDVFPPEPEHREAA